MHPPSRIKQVKPKLISFGIIFLALACAFVISKFHDNTYYYLYPQATNESTWVILCFTFIISSILFLFRKKYRTLLKNNLIVYIIFVLSLLLSTSFFVGSMHYLLYLYDKSSFIIDEDINKYQIKNEYDTFDKIRHQLIFEKRHCMESLVNLAKNKLKISEKDRYAIPFLVKSNRVKTYELTSGDIGLELNRVTTPIPVDPRKPPKDPNEGYNYYLSIIKNNQTIQINDRDQNRDFFIKYFDNPYSPSKEPIINIIKSHTSIIDSNIERIDKNKNLVKNRGLPLSQFAYDTFMKSVQLDQNVFKILSWKSRVLYMLQLFLTVLIISPFLIDIKEKIIKRISQ